MMFDGPAVVRYEDYLFKVLEERGGYVLCAVSGRRIPLQNLLYWSAARQEAYASAAESTQRWLEARDQI